MSYTDPLLAFIIFIIKLKSQYLLLKYLNDTKNII